MNVALWIVQVLLAALFLFGGVMKLMMSSEELSKAIALPVWFMRFISVCEVLGAVGLILPWLLRIRPWLTPLAAACLVVIMIGAVVMTLMMMGVVPALLPLVVGLLLLFVAWGRRRPQPNVR